MVEDFLCTVLSDSKARRSEVEDCLSASTEKARRDPETGIITLTLNLIYTPLRPCRLTHTHTHKEKMYAGKWNTLWGMCLFVAAAFELNPVVLLIKTLHQLKQTNTSHTQEKSLYTQMHTEKKKPYRHILRDTHTELKAKDQTLRHRELQTYTNTHYQRELHTHTLRVLFRLWERHTYTSEVKKKNTKLYTLRETNMHTSSVREEHQKDANNKSEQQDKHIQY